MSETFVIYSAELKGFIPQEGDVLTTDINQAKTFTKAGDAMQAAYLEGKKRKTTFKFYKL